MHFSVESVYEALARRVVAFKADEPKHCPSPVQM
jgi:hypothetical protein